jgi:hypothetical protein
MNEQQYLRYLSYRFIKPFYRSSTPDWKCPHCENGLLSLRKDSLSYEETPDSRSLHSHPDWEPDWIDYRFTASFECNKCTGITFVCGIGNEIFYPAVEAGDEDFEDIEFIPKYFEPAIPLFAIPKGCPDSIGKILKSAFSVAWADLASGCNRLRVAVEKLIFELDPSLNGTLHQKLEALSESHREPAHLLMAIKWLGNDASHDGSLRECDLAFGFRAMESVLKDLYANERDELRDLASIVNAGRGSPART